MSKLDQMLQALVDALNEGDVSLFAERLEELRAAYPDAADVIITGITPFVLGQK